MKDPVYLCVPVCVCVCVCVCSFNIGEEIGFPLGLYTKFHDIVLPLHREAILFCPGRDVSYCKPCCGDRGHRFDNPETPRIVYCLHHVLCSALRRFF